MKEEMGKNEEVRANQQSERIRTSPKNLVRRQVAAFWIVFWFFLALVALFFWLLRLLGWIDFV